MPTIPPGVDLSFKQLINALLYKCKYQKDQLQDFPQSDLDSIDRKLQIASSAVRGCRNALQKINQLPPELLFNIISDAQMHLSSFLPDLSAYEDHGREWYSLLGVCRHWRGVIARSPSLWTRVDNSLLEDDDQNPSHERYLSRSSGAPLTVFLGTKDAKIRLKTLQALLNHVSRFSQLHIIADLWEDPSTPIYTYLTSPAPNLESLTLRTDGKDATGGVLQPIFNGEMPKLRQVHLEHFTIWPQTYFHNLTKFSLSDQTFNRPTTVQFLDFIENSPLLEVLALVRAGPTLPDSQDVVPPPSTSSSRRVVRLDRIKEISLGGWPSTSMISRFLGYLAVPERADVYIWGSVFSNADTDLKAMLPEETGNLKNLEGVRRWYLTHYSVAQPGDLLYVPFTAIVGSSRSSSSSSSSFPSLSSPSSSSSSDRDSGSDSGNALHNYGVFRSSQLLATLPKYPLHNITTFVLRDSSYQANRFKTSVWVEIFSKLVELKELRILAYQSTTTTRSVLTALLPAAPRDGKGKESKAEGEEEDDEEEELERDTAGPSTVGGSSLHQQRTHQDLSTSKVLTSPLSSPLLGDHSRCLILCPKLSHLSIEHDPDLASIFITKLVKSRKDHGCPIEEVVILVFDPNPQYGNTPSSPRPRNERHSLGHDHDHGNGIGNVPNIHAHTHHPHVHHAHHGHGHGHMPAHAHAHNAHNVHNIHVLANPSSSTLSTRSSRDILSEEYNLRSREDEELLRKYVKEVKFVYKKPLSQDLVPKGWPTDAYRRTCLPYSF